ncbi:MAG: F0F1 ATP synthase subunit A [Alphaproteobacteria bacterium]|nr:F0F1 ATP synthase subunit A [Alphaproteobacteria bacterium]
MASYEPEAPYAIRQFEIDVLIPIHVFGLDLSFTTSAQAMVTTVILVGGYLLYAIQKRARVPGRLQSSVEVVYKFVANTVVKTAGPEAKGAIPFVFCLFVFILFGSLFGLTPVKFTFTSHLIVTMALSLLVFAYTNTLAVRRQGAGFFRFFLPAGTPGYMAPLLVVIEVISYLFRPITLGVRIFANILAGHIMIKLFADFCVMLTEALGAAGLGISIMPILLMAVLYGFEVLIFLVQSYIFILITSLYIRDALHGH